MMHGTIIYALTIGAVPLRTLTACSGAAVSFFRPTTWPSTVRSSPRWAGQQDFEVGDRVQVVKDVFHEKLGGQSSKGLVGCVVSVWEICAEDPACCCAELATDAPVEVVFGEPVEWLGYFAEDELRLLPPILHWRERVDS